MPHFRHLFDLKQGMGKNFGPFLGAAFGLFGALTLIGALSGCDDSDHGKPHAKVAKVQTDAGKADVGKIGAGWLLTSKTHVSNWTFAHKTDPSAPSSLSSIHAALAAKMLPPRDSVQIAELVNFILPVSMPDAVSRPQPQTILIDTPWNEDTVLLWVETPEPSEGVSIEFNPESVAAFRPLGDPSALPPLESGQSGTAMLYELQLQPNAATSANTKFAVLRSNGAEPSGIANSSKRERPITGSDLVGDLDDAPEIVRFAAAVAGFGGLLRGDPAMRDLSCGDVIALAQSANQTDPDGRRAHMIDLIRRATPLIERPSSDPSLGEGPR